MPAGVEPLGLEFLFDEVIAYQMGAADVERPELRARRFALGTKDAAEVFLIRFAEELDNDAGTLDVAPPAEARFGLLEARLLQVVLERSVRLWRLVAEGKPITRSMSVVPT